MEERVTRHARLVFVEEHVGGVVFQARRPPAFERNIRRLRSFISQEAATGAETFILCDNRGQASRLDDLLADRRGGPPAGCHMVVGSLAEGFRLDDRVPPVNILTDHEIFRRGRKLRRSRRYRGSASLESLAQLSPGDHVVHMDHGIGRFRGLERVEIGGESIEALVVGYAGGEILRVPVYRLDEVERWVGTHPGDRPASLHRIGGRRWKRLKSRTPGRDPADGRRAAGTLRGQACAAGVRILPGHPLAAGDGGGVPLRGHARPARRRRGRQARHGGRPA